LKFLFSPSGFQNTMLSWLSSYFIGHFSASFAPGWLLNVRVPYDSGLFYYTPNTVLYPICIFVYIYNAILPSHVALNSIYAFEF
jgi:hypothetical protein